MDICSTGPVGNGGFLSIAAQFVAAGGSPVPHLELRSILQGQECIHTPAFVGLGLYTWL